MKRLFLEFDLAGAEWVVTAYLCGDKKMIEVANGSESPHVITGSLISGAPEFLVKQEHKLVGNLSDPNEILVAREPIAEALSHVPFVPRTMSIRQGGKKSNHGLNYGMRYRRFALENEMPETDAKRIVDLYSTAAYPGLPDWWKEIVAELRRDRTLTNCFGRRRRFLDEWGPDLHMAAFAFKPQSTVFDVCRTGMERIYNEGGREELLAQVHDSVFYQYPCEWREMAEFVHWVVNKAMSVPLDYGTGVFRLGVDCKAGWNRGDMRAIKTDCSIREVEAQLRALEDILEPQRLDRASA